MQLKWLDHVNIRTGNLDTMTRFYTEVIGLEVGARPSFRFNGAWLYLGAQAVVHLVERERTPPGEHPRMEHFAIRARGMASFLDRLKARGVDYDIATVPDLEIRQVNVWDPDGNHIEVQFEPDEAQALGL